MAARVVTGTADVDVMVTTSDYSEAVSKLRADEGLKFRGESDGVATFGITALGGVGLDVLDAASFSGIRSGEEFFRFVETEASYEKDGIRYAKTAVVWYTRLMIRRWETYAEKILVNALDGAPPGALREVEQIAERFGAEETIRPRIASVRKNLARPDLEYELRDQ